MRTIKYLISTLVTLAIFACAPRDTIQSVKQETSSYIVVLKKGAVQFSPKESRGGMKNFKLQLNAVSLRMNSLSQSYALKPALKIFSHALYGGVYELSPDQVVELGQDPAVAYVEKDQRISIQAVQENPAWGLDRIDQQVLPLDHSYNYSTGSALVNAYIIDTGILTTHSDFQGRASSGYDFVDKDSDATDCNGHGTHVAGTIGSGTYGVAKNVRLHAVRVLDCSGSGNYSDVIAGIDWVAANHIKPAVANLSLGGPISQAVDDAVKAAIQAGVTFAVAAGNSNADACATSPSRVAEAITVGSSTNLDARSSFSNYGSCVDIFAPGSDIKSLWYNSSTATNTISGTSMASPHAAGVAALYLAAHPNAQPSAVVQALVAGALSGKVTNSGVGSPNKLLNTAFLLNENNGGGGDGENPPVSDKLLSGVTVANLSGAKGEVQFFIIEVPVNSASLTIDSFGGTGDADLYVRFGSAPTTTLWDCRPYKSGNFENCSFTNPKAGTYHVLIHAYTNYAGAGLKAAYTAGNGIPECSGCEVYSGGLSATGTSVFLPSGASYLHAGGTQQIVLNGPDGTDFDLYLYKESGTSLVQVASSTSIKSVEQINYTGVAGKYRIKVYAYSGSGAFRVTRK